MGLFHEITYSMNADDILKKNCDRIEELDKDLIGMIGTIIQERRKVVFARKLEVLKNIESILRKRLDVVEVEITDAHEKMEGNEDGN